MSTTRKQLEASRCLSCGSENVVKRGLCYACYEKYRREREKLPTKQRTRFDDELIASKLLAPDARVAINVFTEVRERVAREFADQTIAEVEADMTSFKAKNETKKPKPPRKKAN